MYEIIEHTADVGIRVRAPDVARLFAEAAEGLFSVMVVNLPAVRTVQEMAFRVEGSQYDELLHDWLDELLYAFATQHVLFREFSVAIEGNGLTATARGEPIDLARHDLDSEVKAITYHELKVERHAEGWLAEVILDL
jgi:SHS2 domain-containing protein